MTQIRIINYIFDMLYHLMLRHNALFVADKHPFCIFLFYSIIVSIICVCCCVCDRSRGFVTVQSFP